MDIMSKVNNVVEENIFVRYIVILSGMIISSTDIIAIRYALNTQFLSIPYQKILPRVKKLSFGYVKTNSGDEILRKKRENI